MTLQRLRVASFLLSLIGGGLQGSLPLYEDPFPTVDFRAFGGFRQDQLDFSIREKHRRKHSGGNSASVKWKSLNIAQVGAILNYSTYNHYCFKASADYGKICSGHADIGTRIQFQTIAPPEPRPRHKWRRGTFPASNFRRSRYGVTEDRKFNAPIFDGEIDLLGDSHKSHTVSESLIAQKSHRKRHRRHRHHQELPVRYNHHVEISRQSACADDGDVADISAAIGYKVISDSRRTWVSGLLGWSGEGQCVYLSNVRQKVDSHSVIGVGTNFCLNGKYKTRWQGPWVGFDFCTLVDYNISLFGSGEWHWSKFDARGDWRFGELFDACIRHSARGYGVKGVLGLDWNFCSSWTFGVIGNYQQWSTRRGKNHHKIGKNNLPSEKTATIFPLFENSALNQVKWISFSVSAQIVYRF